MHEITIRFEITRRNKVIDVNLDERLSFEDNFRLLKQIDYEDFENVKMVYDSYKKIFLKMNVPIQRFEIHYYASFKLY